MSETSDAQPLQPLIAALRHLPGVGVKTAQRMAFHLMQRDQAGARQLAHALVEALDTVAGATGNSVYEKAVHRMRDDVSVGYPLNMSMKQVNLFPHMVIQMTAIGEEAGALDAMLFKVAEYYEQEVNNAVDALSSLIEPFIMIFIGGVIGAMVVGMYLPIFKLAATM